MLPIPLLRRGLLFGATLCAGLLTLAFGLMLIGVFVTNPPAFDWEYLVFSGSSTPFYALALWLLRSVFKAGDGTLDGALHWPRPVRWSGFAVVSGALMDIVIGPLSLFLVLGPGHGALAHYLPSAIVLLFAGFALVFAASVGKRADALQQELDQFV